MVLLSPASLLLIRANLTKCASINNIKKLNIIPFLIERKNYGTETTVIAAPIDAKKQKVSKAMKAYLQRAQEHDEFMKTQNFDYQIGKRHLANMMGEDAETFTQEDIDRAIEYLLPSGLFEKKARPMLKPPEEIFPARKAAEFDETGRPFHSMFYTGKPNFFKLLYDIVEEINKLYEFDERMMRKGNNPDPNQKLDSTGYEWLSKEQIEKKLVETIADIEYTNFVNAMDRLLSLPYSYKAVDFINKYRKSLLGQTAISEIPKPQYDEKGRMFITTYECRRKSSRGEVTIRMPGTGEISINGQPLTYFENVQPREQVSGIYLVLRALGPLLYGESSQGHTTEIYS